MPRNYWMVVISAENFRITKELGFTVQGLKSHHHRKVQRFEPEDRILYYIAGDRYFPATATATSKYFEDSSPTWTKEGKSDWTYRVHIKPEIVLDEDQYIDARQLAPRLDYVRRWPPEDWYIAFAQTNLHLLPKRDFGLVEDEMRRLRGQQPLGPEGPSSRGDGAPRHRQSPRGSRPGPRQARTPAPGPPPARPPDPEPM